LYYETAMLHFQSGNYSRALDLFGQFRELQELPASHFGILGETEHEKEREYLSGLNDQILACGIAREAAKFSRVEAVENLGPAINSSADEYFPCVSNDQTWILYTSRRNRFADEDLFVSFFAGEWMEGLAMPPSFLTSHNEGMSTLVRNGRRMFFTACGRPAVLGTCDIWEADMDGPNVLRTDRPEGELNSDAWDSQATVSCDGQTIYFASNREGGSGGTDIWMSRLLPDGSWDTPVNLGPAINTPADEEAPFITNDGKSLFFSSNGHDGLGEQDIFLSRFDQTTGQWSRPMNLGPPVNSAFRELGLFLTADGQTGYFASNRAGGYGGMDIYQFDLPELLSGRPITFVEGQVLDSVTWQPLSATLFTDDQNKVYADEDGRFFLCLPVDSIFTFTIIEPGYAVYYDQVRVPVWNNRKPYPLSILLQPTQILYTEEAGIISFSGNPGRQVSHAVYFDFDQAELTDQAIRSIESFLAKLPEHSGIREVEIIGFSDQVGSEKYNLVLSENRAKSVALYLKEQGFHIDRLYIAGSGELITSIPEAEKRKVEVVFHLK
jgi:outer membrane protein OmpA-like peptidoglycan-associated protein